ncbi:hypothetical protein AG1IA_03696 [Rhizoctonia solani AG-1 IA]|uniref:Uncharacterized protein n=1 Tax=Thanatephorus cucumeris (strain AG1-IA) TaxID=983506 RepID=L8WZQ1_THACA|nr:hypothetical protein AG1IA_03696 [Rhizoctonia solani AG-1 IA]
MLKKVPEVTPYKWFRPKELRVRPGKSWDGGWQVGTMLPRVQSEEFISCSRRQVGYSPQRNII